MTKQSFYNLVFYYIYAGLSKGIKVTKERFALDPNPVLTNYKLFFHAGFHKATLALVHSRPHDRTICSYPFNFWK
jgi:hypothetical protein